MCNHKTCAKLCAKGAGKGVGVAVLVSIYHHTKQRKENKQRLNKTSKATNLQLVKQSM